MSDPSLSAASSPARSGLLPEGQVEVEIEVEVTRREKRRFTVDVSDGMSTMGATWETGRFWRAVNYWMHQPRDLGKRESATLVGLRFIQPCQPENLFGDHEYEPIPNSDQAARCKRCGRVSGK